MIFSPELLLTLIIAALSLVFNFILLFILLRLRAHYNSLTAGSDPKTLMQALTGIQKTLAEHEKTQVTLKHALLKLQDDTRLHLQSMTLKRFNPFSDTGGDQSFILSLVD